MGLLKVFGDRSFELWKDGEQMIVYSAEVDLGYGGALIVIEDIGPMDAPASGDIWDVALDYARARVTITLPGTSWKRPDELMFATTILDADAYDGTRYAKELTMPILADAVECLRIQAEQDLGALKAKYMSRVARLEQRERTLEMSRKGLGK